MEEEISTRDRLIDATVELVAERGYEGTSVGDIESRAGLAPRSGALYKYFDSKLAVLEAGLQRHLASVAATAIDLVDAPLVDLAAEVELFGRWLLAELDRERMITQVIEREGSRLPELRDRMRSDVSDRGYRAASTFVRRWSGHGDPALDHEALAVLLVGALVNVRRSTWTFGAEPLGLDDERVIRAFVSIALGELGATRPGLR